MAVSRAERKKIRNARTVARRNLISRTARTWSRLYRESTESLKNTVHSWLDKLETQARRDIASGDILNPIEIPETFTETLQSYLREAMAQGYWLNHLYVQEIKAAYQGRKYCGKVTLSDIPNDEELRELLQDFVSFENDSEWHEIIPVEAVNWLENYVPTLVGVLNTAVLERTRDVIRNSLLEGSTLRERMKAVRESSEELASMARQRIEAIARTEITRADSMGRLISMKANDDVIGVEFSAIMDDRTTEMCIARNGLVMRLDDPRLPENTPPLHVNCRSLLVSLTVYDFPDGVLTSHEFDEVPAGMQRPEDIAEVSALLEGVNSANNINNTAIDIRTKVNALIQQDEEYKRQYKELQTRMENAASRHDEDEYNKLFTQQNELVKAWRELSPRLREAKIEAAEQGIIFASGISKKLGTDDVQAIIQDVEKAPEAIRKVWNIFEDRMKIADTYSKHAYYRPIEKAVYVNISQCKNQEPRNRTLFHELGHLIDNSGGGWYSQWLEFDLYDSLVSEASSYINDTLGRLKKEAVSLGVSPKTVKKADAYNWIEQEIWHLPMKTKATVSDMFSGVTKNKVQDGYTHPTSYWKVDETQVCLEFFAQTFSDSINNPEAIELTKKYFPKSYNIFEQIIDKIGGKKQ